MPLVPDVPGPSGTDSGTAVPPSDTLVTLYADEAAPWPATDTLVSDPTAWVSDPEYDSEGHRVAFGSNQRELWVADLDPETGVIDPPDLRGVRVDTEVALFGGGAILNGPEFAQTDGGGEIVYARQQGDDYLLMRAWFDGVAWANAPIDGVPGRVAPLGSQEPGDPDARIVWVEQFAPITHWSHLDGREGAVLGADLGHVPRFALGSRAIVWEQEVDGVPQVHRYDEATGAIEALTDDPAPKGSPWMWSAPEYGGETLFFATRADETGNPTSLDVYRERDGRWQVIVRIVPPADHPVVVSPEAWVAGGRSLVVFEAKGLHLPSQIWVSTTAVPGDGELRRCDGALDGTALDPEWANVGGQAQVYYTEEIADRTTIRLCATGFADE